MQRLCRTPFFALWLAGCAAAPGPAGAPESAPALASGSAQSAPVARQEPPSSPGLVKAPPQGGRSCGALGCLLFETPEAAFAHVLQSEPEVLAIGEAHPLRGAESVEPASRRFATALLPLLRPRATDLVIELMLPNPACRKETIASARNEQKVVT